MRNDFLKNVLKKNIGIHFSLLLGASDYPSVCRRLPTVVLEGLAFIQRRRDWTHIISAQPDHIVLNKTQRILC